MKKYLFFILVALLVSCKSNPEIVDPIPSPIVEEKVVSEFVQEAIEPETITEEEEFISVVEEIHIKYFDILDDFSTYKVVWRDTLSKIAVKNWGKGTGYYFPLIYIASKDVIIDPDKIRGRMELRVPNLKLILDDPEGVVKTKEFLLEVAEIHYRNNPEKPWDKETRAKLKALAERL
jgi:hypothetical protein